MERKKGQRNGSYNRGYIRERLNLLEKEVEIEERERGGKLLEYMIEENGAQPTSLRSKSLITDN